MKPRVLVSIVTCNSARDVPGCLESLDRQTYRGFQTVLLDNASADGTLDRLAAFAPRLAEIIRTPSNLGFSAGHNRILAGREAEYVLFLNPDTLLAPDFLEKAVAGLDDHPECGSLSPKLFRLSRPEDSPEKTSLLDSTGIYWTSNQRHLDRGSGTPDRGQFDQAQFVFGVTGAAAFYRRECLRDIAFNGEIWDEDFFLYREDADLAWRAAWRGWKCVYNPGIHAWHARRVLPQNRRDALALANLHSVKNRFLLRLKNMPLATYLRFFIPITCRDLGVAAYLPFFEPRSLPAFYLVARLLPRFLAKRRHVLGRRKASRPEMEEWFRRDSLPLAP